MATSLTNRLRNALRSVLADRFTEALEADIARALEQYANRDTKQLIRVQQQHKAIAQIEVAARNLQRAIERGDRAFGVKPAPAGEKRHSTGFIYSGWGWYDLEVPLEDMINRLARWRSSQAGPSRRRGNPHSGRRFLRNCVLAAFTDAGIPLKKDARGKAATALSFVLEEADRIDRKPARSRAEFSGTQWCEWVDDFNSVGILLTRNTGG